MGLTAIMDKNSGCSKTVHEISHPLIMKVRGVFVFIRYKMFISKIVIFSRYIAKQETKVMFHLASIMLLIAYFYINVGK